MSGFDLPAIDSGLRARLDALTPRRVVGGELGELEPVRSGGAAGFGGALADALGQVDSLSKRVGEQVQDLATGEPVALHDIMMSMGKSETAFNLMLEVRNKLVDAWEKLSRSVV